MSNDPLFFVHCACVYFAVGLVTCPAEADLCYCAVILPVATERFKKCCVGPTGFDIKTLCVVRVFVDNEASTVAKRSVNDSEYTIQPVQVLLELFVDTHL